MTRIGAFAAALDGRIDASGIDPGGCDWEDVIGQANRTLTTAGLALHWAERPEVPEDARAFLTAVLDANGERNRRLMVLLEEVLGVLDGIGAVPILLKGAALVLTPGTSAMRSRIMGDIDLMLPAGAMRDAHRRLGQVGFVVHDDRGLPDAPIVLYRESDVGMVDLHARMKGSNPRFDHALLSAHCRPVTVGSREALLPSAAAQAGVLISHDQLQELDYWRGVIDMRHLVDLADLSRSGTGIDWQILDDLFGARQSRRALRAQLLTLRALFEVAVPQEYCTGLWPRIQHRRQLLQAEWPGLRWPLTLLALALQLPRAVRDDPGPLPGGVSPGSLPARFHRAGFIARKAVRSPGPGKYS
ncbi:nucleotidyltransferase family protein [Novosphingobium sp. BL-8A]|uniref:nucleotidyltransferase family protein n=1 Tax=Novosphingobium sp. BL-8A TaxID=3127639 RepID=UPI0037569F00